jgi:hypothetical protein
MNTTPKARRSTWFWRVRAVACPVVLFITLMFAIHDDAPNVSGLLAALGVAGVILAAAAAFITRWAYRRAVAREWGWE